MRKVAKPSTGLPHIGFTVERRRYMQWKTWRLEVERVNYACENGRDF